MSEYRIGQYYDNIETTFSKYYQSITLWLEDDYYHKATCYKITINFGGKQISTGLPVVIYNNDVFNDYQIIGETKTALTPYYFVPNKDYYKVGYINSSGNIISLSVAARYCLFNALGNNDIIKYSELVHIAVTITKSSESGSQAPLIMIINGVPLEVSDMYELSGYKIYSLYLDPPAYIKLLIDYQGVR